MLALAILFHYGRLEPCIVLPSYGDFPFTCSIDESSSDCAKQELQRTPLLPKITMVGISAGEAGMNKANFMKSMEDLTKELEQAEQGNSVGFINSEFEVENRDPLFVANVGNSGSGLISKTPVRAVGRGKDGRV